MNCSNCGGAMTLVRGQDYFFCPYCGSFYFPEESDEGIRLLDRDADGLICPICRLGLTRASINRFPAYYCEKCRGMLMARPSFGALVEYRRTGALGPAESAFPVQATHLSRTIDCPGCGKRLDTQPYQGPGNIVIDTCSACDLIWLDAGELRLVIDAPGRNRGDVRRRLKIWLEGTEPEGL